MRACESPQIDMFYAHCRRDGCQFCKMIVHRQRACLDELVPSTNEDGRQRVGQHALGAIESGLLQRPNDVLERVLRRSHHKLDQLRLPPDRGFILVFCENGVV